MDAHTYNEEHAELTKKVSSLHHIVEDTAKTIEKTDNYLHKYHSFKI